MFPIKIVLRFYNNMINKVVSTFAKIFKNSDLQAKLVILYVKIPDTLQTTTVPEKVDIYFMVCIERLELST